MISKENKSAPLVISLLTLLVAVSITLGPDLKNETSGSGAQPVMLSATLANHNFSVYGPSPSEPLDDDVFDSEEEQEIERIEFESPFLGRPRSPLKPDQFG